MNASKLSSRAPIADAINGVSDDLADIYSMFRIRKGYAGYCRRVLRTSDNAERDIGFTAGGFYNIKEEIAWAAGSSTRVLRWYNQSLGAGAHPDYLSMPSLSDSPVGLSAGSPVTFRGHPAILLPQVTSTTLVPNSFGLGSEEFLSLIWIGQASLLTANAYSLLATIHGEGLDEARPLRVTEGTEDTLRDDGPYIGRISTLTHPTSDFTNPTLYVASYKTDSPFVQTGWVNGSERIVSTIEFSDPYLDAGPLQLSGRQVVHTAIVDGGGVLSIHNLAKTAFNARNWIY